MKVLIIGDIYGIVGRDMIKKWVAKIKNEFLVELVIANGENTTHGKSLSQKHYDELKTAGIDVITTGNHIFGNPAVAKYIINTPDLLRPLNYNPYHPGNGTILVNVNTNKGIKKVRVTNFIGRTFMDNADNPYYALEKLIEYAEANNEQKSDIHIIDFHAETTAEKLSFAWNFDGKITCLVGTHTHVQTADNRLLPKGTAFISDLGMTGPFYSIIGANPKEVIIRDKTSMPAKFSPAVGDGQFCAVILSICDDTNRVLSIKRIFIHPQAPELTLYQ